MDEAHNTARPHTAVLLACNLGSDPPPFCPRFLFRGNLQAQNAKGHLVGHIKAIGTDASLEGVRPYTTNTAHGEALQGV